MFDKLKAAEERFLFLEDRLASPDVAQNQEEFTKIMKEYKNLTPIIEKYREHKKLTEDMEGARLLMEEGGELYDMALEERPQLVVANKTDIIQDKEAYEAFLEEMKKRGLEVFEISAATGKGVSELMKRTFEELQKLPPIITFEPQIDLEAERFVDKSGKGFEINIVDGVYVITGSWIEAVGGSVTFDDNESLGYFQRALINRGVIEELVNMGIKEGDLVQIGDLEFEFVF